MSDTALTRLKSKYVTSAARAAVYEVVSCYFECGMDPLEGLAELRAAAASRNDPGLAEAVGSVIELAGKDDERLGNHILTAFDNASPAEIVFLKASDVAAANMRPGIFARAAALARLLK
jgi:hypothetical protein